MKRVVLLVMVLLLAGVAIAEGLTPAMFLGSRGLMVLDENRLNSMNQGENSNPVSGAMFNGLDVCVYSVSEDNRSESIVFTDDGVFYVAIDMLSMFNGGGNNSGSGNALMQTFIDLCNAYDFDLYGYSSGKGPMLYYGDMSVFADMARASGVSEEEIQQTMDAAAADLPQNKEEFIAALKEKE